MSATILVLGIAVAVGFTGMRTTGERASSDPSDSAGPPAQAAPGAATTSAATAMKPAEVKLLWQGSLLLDEHGIGFSGDRPRQAGVNDIGADTMLSNRPSC
ncbi:hypothetical protein [Amycolatopsis sp. FDAARGOS 1241]|uniref:hypothetical protein n=1 Tax=Amycolatopsis sp. FDAARGOS 1241 TaxID=2778070 RepID=UPI00194F9915|nr:hypothetical protein [Amycolatopsis sp. FDAARGOS 1241]QRP43150.1 hypothetical protein I6J71_27395 [Amycolatopsis sp. FDAARGOS 1241]